MAREARRVDTGGGETFPDHERDGLARQPCRMDTAMPIHVPENGASQDAGEGQPSFEGGDRAMPRSAIRDADFSAHRLLIGLGAPETHNQALAHSFDISTV